MMIRVVIPYHLRTLARVDGELKIPVEGTASVQSVLDSLETQYPMLRGTVRDHGTFKRRPFIRFFVCGKDISLDPADHPLPDAIVAGTEPFLIIGSIAGG